MTRNRSVKGRNASQVFLHYWPPFIKPGIDGEKLKVISEKPIKRVKAFTIRSRQDPAKFVKDLITHNVGNARPKAPADIRIDMSSVCPGLIF